MNASRRDVDVFTIASESPKKPLRDWTAANVAGANKENAFHGRGRACERTTNLVLNATKVNRSQPARNTLESASALDLEKNAVPAGMAWTSPRDQARAAAVAKRLLPTRPRARRVDVDAGSSRQKSCAE